MSFKVFFSRWLTPRRRPIDGNGKPTNLLVGELTFDQTDNTFYIGTQTGVVPLQLGAAAVPGPIWIKPAFLGSPPTYQAEKEKHYVIGLPVSGAGVNVGFTDKFFADPLVLRIKIIT